MLQGVKGNISALMVYEEIRRLPLHLLVNCKTIKPINYLQNINNYCLCKKRIYSSLRTKSQWQDNQDNPI